MTTNSLDARGRLAVGDATYEVFRLGRVDGSALLPYSLNVLLESLLRNEDGVAVTVEQAGALAAWDPTAEPSTEIQFSPARVLMQDSPVCPAWSISSPCQKPTASTPTSTRSAMTSPPSGGWK